MGFIYIAKAAKPPTKRARLRNNHKRQEALLKRMGNVVTIDLLKGIKEFKARIDAEALQAAWAKGDYHAVMHEVPWHEMGDSLAPAYESLGETVSAGAKGGLEVMTPNAVPALRYDMMNPAIRAHVAQAGHRIAGGLAEDGRALISSQISRWFYESSSPAQVAERIRGSVGLLPSHEIAVQRYRQTLQQKGASPGRVRDQVEAYTERLLKYRLTMIARTETAAALVAGRRAIWQEAINQGIVPRHQVTKEWLSDGAPCHVCLSLNGQKVGFDERFKDKMGGVHADPPTHPHCQCLLNYDSNI